MGTNYYITRKGQDPNWRKTIHIAKRSGDYYTLQAICGTEGVSNLPRLDPRYVVQCYAEVSGFPYVEDWHTMKTVILDDDLEVVDEYGDVQDKQTFISEIESLETNDRGKSFRRYVESDNPSIRLMNRYTDAEGYSFERNAFS